MKTLTIVRHAKSSWKNTSLPDRDRPLSRRGENDAPEMARRIAAAGIRPSLIVSSPAKRAWKTAKIIARELGYPLEFLQREDDLYLASVNKILDVLVAQDERFNNIMLFGHNPGLTNNLPTCGVVSVSFDRDDWSLYDRPDFELGLYDYPKRRAD